MPENSGQASATAEKIQEESRENKGYRGANFVNLGVSVPLCLPAAGGAYAFRKMQVTEGKCKAGNGNRVVVV